ncbi:hypothetical protein ONZ45_g138 [Pleurotus djamor]|nr:hypothetical protein ONZ45_g138 [Pleurotus djamor]
MDLPTPRELELEVSLRQRDVQVTELCDEVSRLRQYLATQPGPSATDPITLPPSFLSILLPQLEVSKPSASSKPSTVTAALTQKVKALQEENDELYTLLKYTETSKLKEEVESLRVTVTSLEKALQHSNSIITRLSQDQIASRAAFASLRLASHSEAKSTNSDARPPSHVADNGSARSFSRPPPTGPKGHKRPRLSDTQPYHAAPRGNSSAPPSQNHYRKQESRGRSPRPRSNAHGSHRSTSRMDVDEESRKRPRSADKSRDSDRDDKERSHQSHINRSVEKGSEAGREKHRERDRDIGRNKDRGRDIDRERDVGRNKDRGWEREKNRERGRERPPKAPKRNGNFGNNSRPGGGTASPPPAGPKVDESSSSRQQALSADRTLKERMGL